MLPAVEKLSFRNAMSKIGAAVNIITTMGPGGKAGFSATAVCSVTDEPATLLVCLNHSASVYDAVIKNGVLCVNTLSAHQEELAMHFGGKLPIEERFAKGNWRIAENGVPVLEDAMVSCECEISQWQDVGTHRVLFCKVTKINTSENRVGLVYFDRKFLQVRAA